MNSYQKLKQTIDRKQEYIEHQETRIKLLRQRTKTEERYVFAGGVKIDIKPETPMQFVTEISGLNDSLNIRYQSSISEHRLRKSPT